MLEESLLERESRNYVILINECCSDYIRFIEWEPRSCLFWFINTRLQLPNHLWFII